MPSLSALPTASKPGFLFPARHTSRRSRCVARRGLLDLFTGPPGQRLELNEDEAGAALHSWLEQQGLPQQKVAVVADPACGRSLFASAAISKGAPAVRVPGQLFLTAESAAQELSLSRLLLENPLPTWSVLALWLVEARAAGAAHPWARYIEVLPAQTGCVLEWEEAEVGWLRGSHLHTLASEMRDAARASWEEMQPLLNVAEQRGLAPAGVYTQTAMGWAFAVLLSRLIRLPSLANTEALVPWADFLNHDCQAGAFLDWEAASSAVVLRADRQYRPGEQVFVSYGQKTSGQLLLSYGFLPPPGSNHHDACLLPLPLGSPADAALPWKEEALALTGFETPPVFPLRMGALPQGLLEMAALAAAKPGSREQALQLGRQLLGSGAGASLTGGGGELHRAALQEVLRRCQIALRGYPASLEASKPELEGLRAQREAAGQGGGVSRREQVLQLLVFEQQVLSRTVFLLQQQIRQLKRG